MSDEQKKIEGLGDVVKKVTTAIGIKPCGACEKRRQWLNRMAPLGRRTIPDGRPARIVHIQKEGPAK